MYNTFEEYLSKELNESSLSRVLSHYTNPNIPVGTITAFRKEYPRDVNVKRNKELAAQVSANGYGFIYVKGGWLETSVDSDELKPVEEDSLLIIGSENDSGRLKVFLREMVNKYNQDGALFKAQYGIVLQIIEKDKTKDYVIGNNITIQALEKGYTRLYRQKGNRVFSFTETYDAESWIGRMKRLS